LWHEVDGAALWFRCEPRARPQLEGLLALIAAIGIGLQTAWFVIFW
jgi:hypothetical protein